MYFPHHCNAAFDLAGLNLTSETNDVGGGGVTEMLASAPAPAAAIACRWEGFRQLGTAAGRQEEGASVRGRRGSWRPLPPWRSSRCTHCYDSRRCSHLHGIVVNGTDEKEGVAAV